MGFASCRPADPLVFCLFATLRKNFQTDLNGIFREGSQWANEQTFQFWVAIRVTTPDRDPNPYQEPYHDTGKTGLGGGMLCPSASS